MSSDTDERTAAGATRYLEDIEPGTTVRCGSVRLSEADIVDFARRYDPLEIHTDPEAAAESRFGGLIASGYQTLLVAVRAVVETTRRQRAVIAGLGMDDLRWHEPVRPGDRLAIETTILETRPAERTPDAGVLREEITANDRAGETVLSVESRELVERRPSARPTGSAARSRTACEGWDNADCRGTPYCPPRCPRFRDETGRQLLVRPCRSEDADSLARLYDECDREERIPAPDRRPGSNAPFEGRPDPLPSAGVNLVALDGDRVVGHAVVPDDSSEPAVRLFVRPEYRDRGVGSELLRQAIAHADEEGHEALTVAVSTDDGGAIPACETGSFGVAEAGSSRAALTVALERSVVEGVRRPPAARS